VRRILPLALVAALVGGAATFRPGAESGACAQGPAVVPRANCNATGAALTVAQCNAVSRSFASVSVRPDRRGLRFGFRRLVDRPASVDVFQVASGRRVSGERLVARFRNRTGPFRWAGGRGSDGVYVVRFVIADIRGRRDEQRVALRRRNGRFGPAPAFYRRTSCATLTSFRLTRPVFGGSPRRTLTASFRLARRGEVRLELLRGTRVVRSTATQLYSAGRFHRRTFSARGLRPGVYRVRLRYEGDQGSLVASLFARRL
jgi:hypothetical protein